MEIGKALPNWTIESIFGEEVPPVDSLKGKPLLLLFFNLGCPGCVARAIPFANRVVVERDTNINVIGIQTNYEGPEYSKAEMAEARDTYYIRFPIYYDTGISTTFHDYMAAGTPHWILADKYGVVIDSIFGSDPNRALLRLDYNLIEILGAI